MARYPNQHDAKIIKYNYADKKEPFVIRGFSEEEEAFNTLTPATFGLYLYLSRNSNDYITTLSYSAVNKCYHMGKRSYQRAFQELEDAGYLIRYNVSLWYFYNDKYNPDKIKPYKPTFKEDGIDIDPKLEPENEIKIHKVEANIEPNEHKTTWDF